VRLSHRVDDQLQREAWPPGKRGPRNTDAPAVRPEDIMRLPPDTTINFVEPVATPMLLRTPGYWQTPWAKAFHKNPYYHEPRKNNVRPPRTTPRQDHRKSLNDLQRRRKG
jgi:hypothetical protein